MSRSVYLFRNPNASYRITRINRRLKRLENNPPILLFTFGIGGMICYLYTLSLDIFLG